MRALNLWSVVPLAMFLSSVHKYRAFLTPKPVERLSKFVESRKKYKDALPGVSGHYLQVPPGIRALADGWPEASLLLMYYVCTK